MERFPEARALLNEKYGFSLPKDFFRCQEFIEALAREGLRLMDAPVEIHPGLAFEAFHPGVDAREFDPLLRSRYLMDPPEFFTMLGGNTDGLHWGYYSDNPDAEEWVVASYYHSESYAFTIAGKTLLEAIRTFMERVEESLLEYKETDVEEAAYYQEQLDRLDRIRTVLMQYETGDRPEKGRDYLRRYQTTRTVTVPNSAGMGLVVEGSTYKETPELAALFSKGRHTEADKDRLLALGHENLASGFTGTALRIAQELWPQADHHFPAVCHLLNLVYTRLDRPALKKALQAAQAFRVSSKTR